MRSRFSHKEFYFSRQNNKQVKQLSMRQTLLRLWMLSWVLIFGIHQVQSQTTIASWNFASEPGNQAFTAGTGSTLVTASNFTRGSDLTAALAGGSINSSGWLGTGNRYYSFGFTVDEGFAADLATLRIGTRSSGTGPANLALRYSEDGFSTDLATWTQSGTADNFQTIDLSSLPNISGNVEFRIVSTSNLSANGGTLAGGGTFRVLNFNSEGVFLTATVTGGSTDPEPEPEPDAPLAFWDFQGAPGDQVSTAGTGSTQVSALDFKRGPGLTATAAGNSISSASWSTDATQDYFSFGLSVADGFQADLSNLVIATRSSGTGPGNLALRSSLDGFTGNLATWTQSGTNFNNQILDLSTLTGLTGEVEFRIVMLNTTSAGGGTVGSGGTLRVTNYLSGGVALTVQFNGTVTPLVPKVLVNYNFAGEPGSQASTSANVVESGLTASVFTRGSGISPNAGNNSINSSGWDAGENRYYTFGFTVASGKLVDLTTLEFGSFSSGTGPAYFALRYNKDGFSSDLATWTNTSTRIDRVIDLSSLKNLSGEVEFRIVITSQTNVNGGTIASTGTSRITNFFPANLGASINGFIKNGSGVAVPAFTLDPTSLAFGDVRLNQDNPVLTYQLSGTNLTAPVSISVAAPFSISKDGVLFANELQVTAVELTSPITLYVGVSNASLGSFSGNVVHQTSGSSPVLLPVTARVFDPFTYVENFNNSCPAGLPTGWSAVSVAGAQVWACTTFGRAGTSPTASAASGLQINGFAGGAQLNEDWLITPAFDLTDYDFPLLSFWSRVAFTGPRLKLLLSTDYVSGDPNSATWVELDDRFADADVWTFSQELDLSAYKTSGVRLAFVYTSSPEANAARWTLDDFSLINSETPPAPFLRTNIGNVDYFHFGITPVGTVASTIKTFTVKVDNATDPLKIVGGDGFEFSKNGTDFLPELIFSPEETALLSTVSVRFNPGSEGAFSSPIRLETGSISLRRGYLTGATLERSETLDVVTWNIEWFGSPTNGPSDLNRQLTNVKAIIEDLDADIYAFQEITSLSRFTALVEALGGKYGMAVSPAVSAPGEFTEEAQKLTFLFKTATIDTLETKVLLKGVTPEMLVGYPSSPDRFWASGRLPYLMRAKAKIGGVEQKINLINVHTRSNGGGESAANPRYAMRRYDVGVLKDTLDAQFAEVPFILLGDYNDDLDETVADQNAATVGTSETSFIRYINDAEGYIPVTLNLSNAGLRTFITFENVIDHFIISNEMEDLWVKNSERVVAPFDVVPTYQGTTSDHLPVETRFRVFCDIESAQIVGTSLVCGAEDTINLTLIGGQFEEVLGWEISLDQGETWTLIDGSTNQTALEYTGLTGKGLFRAILDSKLCTLPSASFEVTFSQLPVPVIYFANGLLTTIEGNYTYKWFKNGQLLSTSSQNSIRINGAANYSVTILDEFGCESSSQSYRFPSQLAGPEIKVFPNPASNLVTITAKRGEGMIRVQLMTSMGMLIQEELTSEGFAQFDVTSLAKGTYLVVVTDRVGAVTVQRLIVN